MNIGKLGAVEGGIVFNVDGLTPHVAVVAGKNADVRSVEPTNAGKFVEWKGTLGGANPSWNDVAASGLDTALDWNQSKAKLGPAPRGQVLLFGPYPIP